MAATDLGRLADAPGANHDPRVKLRDDVFGADVVEDENIGRLAGAHDPLGGGPQRWRFDHIGFAPVIEGYVEVPAGVAGVARPPFGEGNARHADDFLGATASDVVFNFHAQEQFAFGIERPDIGKFVIAFGGHAPDFGREPVGRRTCATLRRVRGPRPDSGFQNVRRRRRRRPLWDCARGRGAVRECRRPAPAGSSSGWRAPSGRPTRKAAA